MELTLQEAESRLCELVTAAENGERVVIVKDGEPSVQLVRCKRKEGGGLDWDRLNDIRRELGIKDAPPEEAEAMIAAFHDSALSRRVLGLEAED
jgi:antitoxin (DNA-binding transcriptional repressor) of toxin-antitoxin stability system